jgi:L-threonylcarbamoyladenylate synthase
LPINYTKHFRIRHATHVIARGGVVAYPTEAVWGLGCDPDNPHAVSKVLSLKSREVGKGLILIAANIDMLEPYLTGTTSEQRQLMASTWPGPVTWLVPDNGVAPPWITGGQSSVAIRVTAHPVAAALSHLFGGPIVSTSANPQSLPAAISLTKIKAYFGNNIDAFTSGCIGQASKPSEIRDLVSGRVIRPG